MKTKSIHTFVAKLKRLNAAYARLQTKRQKTPHSLSHPFPDGTHEKLQAEANKLCGEIMHTERCLINALLREPATGMPTDEEGATVPSSSPAPGEGQVPTTALDEQRVSREAIRPPGSGVDELEYWRGNAMHYHGLCVALEEEIDNYNLALDGKNACIQRRNEWLADEREKLEKAVANNAEYALRFTVLAAAALNARECVRELLHSLRNPKFMAHAEKRAKELLATSLDATNREGGGGGGSENLPPAEEKYNAELSDSRPL